MLRCVMCGGSREQTRTTQTNIQRKFVATFVASACQSVVEEAVTRREGQVGAALEALCASGRNPWSASVWGEVAAQRHIVHGELVGFRSKLDRTLDILVAVNAIVKYQRSSEFVFGGDRKFVCFIGTETIVFGCWFCTR